MLLEMALVHVLVFALYQSFDCGRCQGAHAALFALLLNTHKGMVLSTRTRVA